MDLTGGGAPQQLPITNSFLEDTSYPLIVALCTWFCACSAKHASLSKHPLFICTQSKVKATVMLFGHVGD